MPTGVRFYLLAEYPAHDRVRHQFSRKETREHAQFIASPIGTDNPPLAKPGNFIWFGTRRVEIYEAPIQWSCHFEPGKFEDHSKAALSELLAKNRRLLGFSQPRQ